MSSPLRLSQLAEAKRLSAADLRGLGLSDLPNGVGIPYYDETGVEIATKVRLKLSLSDRADGAPCLWPTRTPLAPYGLWLLDRAARAGFLILVEGESDCWTLWHHEFHALGLPGAYTASALAAEHVARVEKVYVWREPDAGGTAFLTGVYLRLRKLGFRGQTFELSITGIKDPSELHAQDGPNFKARFQAAVASAREMRPEGGAEAVVRNKPEPPKSPRKPAVEVIDAATLLATHYPEWRWAIQDIVPEGASILAGRPKIGKSWLAYAWALAVATGGTALGEIPVEAGEVLYLALEDGNRRLQKRLKKLLAAGGVPGRLHLATRWPRNSEGGIEALEAWLDAHPETRLVIVDTLARVRDKRRNEGALYEEDYAAIAALAELAQKRHLAVLIVHHTRKAESEDPLDDVSGTSGLTGAADVVIVLRRKREEFTGKLFVTGRDVEEKTWALKWDPEYCLWSVDDAAEQLARPSPGRQQVLAALAEAGRPLGLADLVLKLGKAEGTVASLLHRMVKAGQVEKLGWGSYALRGANLQGSQSHGDELPE